MSDRGAMIELRIDTERIVGAAPLYLETVLAGAPGAAAVVAPADAAFAGIASELRAQLRRRTGCTPPLVDESGFDGTDGLDSHAIAVGHAANNALLRRLHELRCLSNIDYPSEGHRLLSIHSPFGDGRNVIAALGYTADTARRSAERLAGHVREVDGTWLVDGRLFDVDPVPDSPDPDELLAANRLRDASASHGRPGAFLTALGHLNATGSEHWARAFVELVTPFATGEIPLSFWLMSAVDFWTDGLTVAWDRAEEFPHFSDEERRLVANFIASCTEYCHDSITYQKWRVTDAETMVFNHHTFPAGGLFFGCMYLRRHGYEVVDIDAWLAKSERVFERAAQAGRSFDEGGAGYSWLVGNHFLGVSAARGDASYAGSEKLLRYADLATVIMNNRFDLVPFGDCGGYHGGGGGAANILLRAAQWHQNPGCKWLAEKCAAAVADADVFTRELRGEPPERHVGLFVLPLDPAVWSWAGQPTFPGYPPPVCGPNVPAEQGFDKLSLRGGWGPDDDYLLLQGFGSGQHGHPDANAISQYQVRGRLFLAESDYIRRMPKQHNTVMVIRDGRHEPVPITARLVAAQQFEGGAVTQTALVDYNGCEWTRTLVWLRGDCLLAVDEVVASVPGDYEVRCYWRTLGTASFTERGLHAEHAGEHFRISELTESRRRLDVEPPPLNGVDYPKYQFGEGSPKVLCETQRGRLQRGDSVCFVNLLLPTGEHDEPRRVVAWGAPGCIGLHGDGPPVTITAHSVRVDDWEWPFPDQAGLAGLTSPSPARPRVENGPPAPAAGAVLWETRLPSPATCLALLDDAGILAGCADGTVVRLDPGGGTQVLTTAEDRIGAVLAGRLYGESETTCLAAGYDATLRLFSPDGCDRKTVPLPRNGHMPAWGRALCLADLDGDGKLWPVVGTAAWRVHAVNPDGTFRWTFDTAAHAVTCLASSDLNGDGREEVAIGTVYFCVPAATADGERLWQDEDYNDYWRAGPTFLSVHIADVDADGRLEVITAASDTLVHCIDRLGEKKWTTSIGDGPAGLCLLDGTIVAASRTGDVHGIDGSGQRLWRRPVGAPCTALAAADAVACVAAESGALVWFGPDGSPTASAQLPAPASHLLLLSSGGTLAACADGAIVCLRGGTP